MNPRTHAAGGDASEAASALRTDNGTPEASQALLGPVEARDGASMVHADKPTARQKVANLLWWSVPSSTDEEAKTRTAELLDALVAEARTEYAEEHRLALSTTLGLGTGAPWDAIRARAAELAGAERPTENAEARARLFGFIEAGATEEDFPSFAAALDEYVTGLRRKLAHAERIRENADFHLGQEMARRQLAEKETAEGLTERTTYPPVLPWAALMDDEDLQEFLGDLIDSLNSNPATTRDVLAEVEKTCGTWRAIAEAQHAHNTAPGPNAEAP